jgi:hypothetical protein
MKPWLPRTWPGGTAGGCGGPLARLLKAAPVSKSAVSRIVGTLKGELEAWRTGSLAELDVFGLYLDAIALRVRSAGKVVSVPVLGLGPFGPMARNSWTPWIFVAGSRPRRGRGPR